jgi:hypothetical protein
MLGKPHWPCACPVTSAVAGMPSSDVNTMYAAGIVHWTWTVFPWGQLVHLYVLCLHQATI